MALDAHGVEIHKQPALAVPTMVDLVPRLPPDVRPDEIQSTGVPGVGGHLMLGVIVSQSHVGQVFKMQFPPIHNRAAVLGGYMADRVFSLNLQMSHEDVVALGSLTLERRRLSGHDRL